MTALSPTSIIRSHCFPIANFLIFDTWMRILRAKSTSESQSHGVLLPRRRTVAFVYKPTRELRGLPIPLALDVLLGTKH